MPPLPTRHSHAQAVSGGRCPGAGGRLACRSALGLLAVACLAACSSDAGDRREGANARGGSQPEPGITLQAVERALAPSLARWTVPDAALGSNAQWPLPAAGAGAVIACRRLEWRADWPVQDVADSLRGPLKAVGAAVLWQQPLAGQAWRLDVGGPGRPTHTLVLLPVGFAGQVRWAQPEQAATAGVTDAGSDAVLVALVIDDCGQRLDGPVAGILALPVPLTLAVLPGLPQSRAVAAMATPTAPVTAGSDAQRQERLAAGCVVEVAVDPASATAPRDVFLHLPMQPLDYPATNPGPGALLVGLDPAEVILRLDTALASVPGARGVNNHMGSAATADPALMATLMGALGERGLLFLDSLTTPHSVAWREARAAGLPVLRNRLFLDVDHLDEAAISARLAELVGVARASGQAIGIGHPHAATAAVLARELPDYMAAGVRFVTISELLALRPPVAAREPEAAHAR